MLKNITLMLSYPFRHKRTKLSYHGWPLLDTEALNKPEPRKYKNHIIMIGSFHILGAYMKMIGNKMQGTGLSDILLESEFMSCGSLIGVLKGKSHARALNCQIATK